MRRDAYLSRAMQHATQVLDCSDPELVRALLEERYEDARLDETLPEELACDVVRDVLGERAGDEEAGALVADLLRERA